MIKTPIRLQDLRKNLYIKAKAEPTWRFWGLYTHVCKRETLQEAYEMAKKNDGAPGMDGVTFEAIEESGVESFLERCNGSHCFRPKVSGHFPGRILGFLFCLTGRLRRLRSLQEITCDSRLRAGQIAMLVIKHTGKTC